ncbi:MAG: N-6 DNA methylase [Melioribacteraceae bacterium]
MDKLCLFFSTDYQSGQGTLFPYQFNNIPIQLISHVYEAFLNDNTKKGKGVYYTPSFVVNFMLSQSLKQKAEENPYLTVFDPAVGSAAFLVESFKMIRDALARNLGKNKLSYDEKKLILQNQLWGVDVDSDALQISAFSLYLALLEDESAEFIREKIKNSHPILPSLIGSTLLHANTIIDSVFEGKKFDFIVSNPPWGSVPTDEYKEHIVEREAIDNKSGAYPEYKVVADYERSQAFLRRIERWQKTDTTIVMIVKNSIFLNDKAIGFRKEFLSKNKLEMFYELSDYNKILFKKRTFTSAKVNIEIGASEPCAIVIFKPNTDDSDYKINYIAPKLTKLGEHFEIIQYTNNESSFVNKSVFFENDLLWKVLANGNIDDLNLIQKIKEKKDLNITIESGRGFEPKKGGELSGQPIWKDWLDIDCFHKYKIDNLKKFNWNQNFRNKRDFIFETDSIAIARRPLKRDSIRLKATIASKGIVYKDNIVFAKIRKGGQYVEDYNKYNLLFNSSLIGFYLNHVSGQWGKGDEKWAALRTKDIEELPICDVDKIDEFNLSNISDENLFIFQYKIDENIYNLYELTDYEKEIINEFYQVKVERASDKLKFVQHRDMLFYFEAFKESFELILSSNHTLNASYYISQNIGAIIKISIVEKASGKKLEQDNTLQVLQFVKNKQLSETDKLMKEEKIKLYEPTHFYLIKSNQFKDWTKHQAFKDAKEEIDLLFSNLPDINE